MPHVIVFGNEKGGSGKTTTAMHVIVSLLHLGFKVASIDLDNRQQSLSRYIKNRQQTLENEKIKLLLPEHFILLEANTSTRWKMPESESNKEKAIAANSKANSQMSEIEVGFIKLLENVSDYDFVIIDTPGSFTSLSSLAHSYADTVVSPINDSFVDVDLLGKINPKNFEMVAPGIYSAMFFEQRMRRAARDKKEINWVIIRNRLSSLSEANKKNVEIALRYLARALGFKLVPGFGDRVIFKELFLHGLTLHDTKATTKIRMTPSVAAARQELRDFIVALGLKEVNELFNKG